MNKNEWRSTRPGVDEFAPFYSGYVARVPDGDIVETLRNDETLKFLRSIPDALGDHRYGPGKWSVKEVIGHMADGERVFAYRAMRFSRHDKTPAEGFDENAFVANSSFSKRTLADLISEFEHLRQSTILMLDGIDEAAMSSRGIANGLEISVRALAFILAGHERHHVEILRTRYL